MARSLFIFSCLIFGAVALDLPVIKTAPVSDGFGIADIFFPISGSGLYTMSYSVPESAVVIMKRNSEGYYQRIVTYNVTSEVITTSTNGKWFAFSESDSTTHVFQVNDVHEVVQKKIFAGASSALQLLSDDSLAFVNGSALTTYHYADNTWTMSGTTQIYITFFPPYLYHLTDKTFAGIDYERSTLSLYRRKEDKSWALKDTFMIGNFSEPLISIVWNGNDTVMLGCFAVEPIGAVWLYTKENEVWNEKVISAGSAIGIKPFGYLGFALLLVDPNTILVSAALDGYSSENAEQLVGGSVNVLSRDSGTEWQWNARLESELNAVYGLGLAVADEDILVLGCGRETQNSTEVQCRYQSLPKCFNQASQVTCNEINSCESISELDLSSLYSVHDPQCGETSTVVSKISADASSVKISLSFTRIGAPSPAMCEAVISCPDSFVSGATVVSGSFMSAILFTLILVVLLF